MKCIYNKDFSIFICDRNIFLPVNLSLLTGVLFESWMSICIGVWFKFILQYISIKIRIGSNTSKTIFFYHEFIYTTNGNSFYGQFIRNLCFVRIQFATLISGSRFTLITVVIFFDSSPVECIFST